MNIPTLGVLKELTARVNLGPNFRSICIKLMQNYLRLLTIKTQILQLYQPVIQITGMQYIQKGKTSSLIEEYEFK